MPAQLVSLSTLPSGRSLIAHAAACGHWDWLSDFVELGVPLAPEPLLKRDRSGHHALDYALKARKPKELRLLLDAAKAAPPDGREPLVRVLIDLTKHYPVLLGGWLTELGLDEYPESAREAGLRPSLDRVPASVVRTALPKQLALEKQNAPQLVPQPHIG